MSFDTTTQVRVFRGSTPTDGSHWIQTMSPRRTSTGSRFIVEQIELRRLEVFQKRAGVRPSGRVIRGEPLAALGRLAARQALAQDLGRHPGTRPPDPSAVPIQLLKRVSVQCQIETRHDTMNSTRFTSGTTVAVGDGGSCGAAGSRGGRDTFGCHTHDCQARTEPLSSRRSVPVVV